GGLADRKEEARRQACRRRGPWSAGRSARREERRAVGSKRSTGDRKRDAADGARSVLSQALRQRQLEQLLPEQYVRVALQPAFAAHPQKRPVRAAHIGEKDLAVAARQAGVQTRDVAVIREVDVAPFSPERDRITQQRIRGPIHAVADDD